MPNLRPTDQDKLRLDTLPAEQSNLMCPLSFLGPIESEPQDSEWQVFLSKVEHTCRSGSCQHALKPKCSCGCKGSGHRTAILRQYHAITEFQEGEPSRSLPHVGLYA